MVVLAVGRAVDVHAAAVVDGGRGRAAGGGHAGGAALLAQHQRLAHAQRVCAHHAAAIGLAVVVGAVLRGVDRRARRCTAGGTGLLARQQRLQQRTGGRADHAGAGGIVVEVLAARGGPHRDAALIRGGGGGVAQAGGGHGFHLALDAGRAGLLARLLGGLLGDGGRAGHAGAILGHVVVGAVGGGVVDLLVGIAQRAGSLALVHRDLLGHRGQGRAGLDVDAALAAVVVDAGGGHDDRIGRGQHIGPARSADGSVHACDGRGRGIRRKQILRSVGRGAGVRAGRRECVRRGVRRGRGLHRHGGRGRDHGERRGALAVAGAGEDRRDQQHDHDDEPDRRHRRDGDADRLVEAVPAPEQVDAQRRQDEQQQIGHPVVLIDVAQHRILVGIGLVAVCVRILVQIAVVIFAVLVVERTVLIVVAIVLIAAIILVAVIVGILPIVVIAVIVIALVEVTIIVGVIVPRGGLGEAASVAVGGVIVIPVAVRAVVALLIGFVVVIFGRSVLALLAEAQPVDLAVAKAVGKSLFRFIDFQFSQLERRHNASTSMCTVPETVPRTILRREIKLMIQGTITSIQQNPHAVNRYKSKKNSHIFALSASFCLNHIHEAVIWRNKFEIHIDIEGMS